jgi:hypothetical protein
MNKIIIALIIIMTLIPITQVNALTEKEYNYEIS